MKTHDRQLTTYNALILIYLLIVSFWLFIPSTFALTEPPPPPEYNLLAPLPLEGAGNNVNSSINIDKYVKGMFQLAIGLAGGLAVLRIIMGGIKYMTTDAFGAKGDAKQTIQDAIIGLLLAISAYTILATVNPKLVNFEFGIEGLRMGPPISSSSPPPVVAGPSLGKTWESDSIDRTQLTNLGITFNKFNCTKVGDTGCTSVLDIGSTVTNSLETLKKACVTCVVRITGGTEYWLHGNRSTEIDQNPTAHKPGGNVVDLSLDPSLVNFLKTKGTKATGTGCTTGEERYNFGGGLYVNEVIPGNDPHWHVCF